MKRICIITSGQPSANPRLVKEAITLQENNFDITVLYTPISPWADKFDQQLFSDTPRIKWIRVGYHSVDQKNRYRFARTRRKVYERLFKSNIGGNRLSEKIISLYSQELKKKIIHYKADMYIAHNLGALPAAVRGAKKHNAFAVFDAEDFHRGEDAEGSLHYNTAKAIEDINFPKLEYITAASPLIGHKYRTLYPSLPVTIINNTFSKKHLQQFKPARNKTLSLFWFSQIVGEQRGLEGIINALNLLGDLDISFNILGNCSSGYKDHLLSLSNHPAKIKFLEPASPENIFKIASEFDIGIASEIPYCENRDICLTNKIFTYLLSGNCIFASDTTAQLKFLNENPAIGILYDHRDVNDIAAGLNKLYLNREMVDACKQASLELAATKYNWEMDASHLLKSVHNLLYTN